MSARALIIGAPRSGSGKTSVTIGLLRALARRGLAVAGAKSGPDYIDPGFHAAASGRPGVNLDSWAMPPTLLASLLARAAQDADLVLVESAMGLFDGIPAPAGRSGAAADLARAFGIPVMLVLDVSGQSQTAAAVAKGFSTLDPEVQIAGVVLNRVGSERHRRLAGDAIEAIGIPVVGAVMRDPALTLPERHLGLVQAEEHADLSAHIDRLADTIARSLDLDRVVGLATALDLSDAFPKRSYDGHMRASALAAPNTGTPTPNPSPQGGGGQRTAPQTQERVPTVTEMRGAGDPPPPCGEGLGVGVTASKTGATQSAPSPVDPATRGRSGTTQALAAAPTTALPPPGQRIAVARDAAFTFLYPHVVAGWRMAGAELFPFSPLADEAPPASCDVCWLPGGYPELHAGRIAAAEKFQAGMKAFAEKRPVHGECGGFMVLGAALEDADGVIHPMLGLLAHSTSFAQRKMNLGYREARLLEASVLGPAGGTIRGHEFHYARTVERGSDQPLAELFDGEGRQLGPSGGRRGYVTGTFFHAIARVDS